MQIDSTDVMQIRKDIRATFADQLGTIGLYELGKRAGFASDIVVFPIGGTLGLFSGISIISIFEFIFWAYRVSRSCICILVLYNFVLKTVLYCSNFLGLCESY